MNNLFQSASVTEVPKPHNQSQATKVARSHSAGLGYNKKFKFVVYGIEESPKGTSRGLCNQHDLDKVNAIVTNLESTITSQSIRARTVVDLASIMNFALGL